jgi:hypothetical protein
MFKIIMTTLEIILVVSIPLASLYLSTISLSGVSAFLRNLCIRYFSALYGFSIQILGSDPRRAGLFQISIISQSLEIFILIIGTAAPPRAEGKEINTKFSIRFSRTFQATA